MAAGGGVVICFHCGLHLGSSECSGRKTRKILIFAPRSRGSWRGTAAISTACKRASDRRQGRIDAMAGREEAPYTRISSFFAFVFCIQYVKLDSRRICGHHPPRYHRENPHWAARSTDRSRSAAAGLPIPKPLILRRIARSQAGNRTTTTDACPGRSRPVFGGCPESPMPSPQTPRPRECLRMPPEAPEREYPGPASICATGFSNFSNTLQTIPAGTP